jgi:Tfp pilus assembly protein PilF
LVPNPTHDPSLRAPSRARSVAVPLLIAVLAVVAHGRGVWNGFIWDDDAYVTANETLRSGDGLRRIWLEPRSIPQYYPLVHTTYWVEYRCWGLEPAGYHAVNVLLHAATAALLFRVFLQVGLPVPWLAAALFAVHPLGVESVGWVTERKNTLSLFLAVAAAGAWFRWRLGVNGEGGKPQWLALAVALFTLAMLAKTVAAMLVPMLLVAMWWKTGRLGRRDVLGVAPLVAVGLPLAGFTVWLEKDHVGADDVEWRLSPAGRLVLAGRAAWFYAQKLLCPWPLAFFYDRWRIDPAQPAQWIFPLGVAATVAGAWWQRRRIGRGPVAALLAFLAGLFPALGFFDVFPFKYSFVADHFAYHALPVGLAAAAAGLAVLCGRAGIPLAVPAAGLIAILLAATCARTGVFSSQETLYRDTLAKNPSCSIAANNLGAFYLDTDRPREAIEPLARGAANAIFSDERSRSLANLAQAFLRLDEPGRAYEAAAAARAARDSRRTRGILARACVRAGKLDEADAVIAAARPDEGVGSDMLLTRGELALARGDAETAATHFEDCLAACEGPPRLNAALEIVIAYLERDMIADAEHRLSRLAGASATAAKTARGWMNVAVAYARREDFQAAVEACAKAAALDPASAEIATLHGRLRAAAAARVDRKTQ